MKSFFRSLDPKWKTYSVAACVAILFYVVITHPALILSYLGRFLRFFGPVILGVVIAYIVDPLAKLIGRTLLRWIKRERPRWILAVVLTLIVILALLGLFIGTLVPQLVSNVRSFIENIDTYIANLSRFIDNLGYSSSEVFSGMEEMFTGENGVFSKIGNYLQQNLSTILKASGSIGSKAMSWVIGFIMAVYLLIDKDRIKKLLKDLLRLIMREKSYERTEQVLGRFHNIFTRYISYSLLDALLVGIVNYAFMRIMGMPDALLVSMVVGVTNLAPTFGPIIGGVIGGFILLLLDPTAILTFILFTFALQTVDGYIIKPRLFGNVLNVPGVLILITIVVGGRMFGVLGILLAIPFAAILVYLYNEMLVPHLTERKKRRAGLQPAEPDVDGSEL